VVDRKGKNDKIMVGGKHDGVYEKVMKRDGTHPVQSLMDWQDRNSGWVGRG